MAGSDDWLSKRYVAETTTHFLPKFDNQNEEKRLDVSQDAVLYVSKKHSGSLVMAPPFYSKNATGNEFSRVGCVILYEFFQTVWPGEGQAKFKEWWENAEVERLCYSFECVTPRILGDHGATPKCAYMVLTAVSKTREERFMSPAELLAIATKWRLPLNEVWLIPGEKANAVERELHKNRWTMRDVDAGAILDKYLAPGHRPQRFLPHGETQGEELEGFVLMALETDFEQLSALVESYNDTMAPFYQDALASARELGQKCLDPALSKEFLKSVRNKHVAPLNMPDVYAEPERLKNDIPQPDVWKLVCENTKKDKTNKLFQRLHTLYNHYTRLQPYLYKGRVQVQVHIMNDEVFYGWNLHTMDSSTAPLFRGMVVTLFPEDHDQDVEMAGTSEVTAAVKIVGIAKLKCLNYMWRTFGVRNRLGILLKRGKADYLKTLKKGFYPPWGIPKQHRDTLDVFFARWADYALALSKSDQKKLTEGYLNFLEDFLSRNPYPLTQTEEPPTTNPPAAVPDDFQDAVSVLIVNLTGIPLSNEKLENLGMQPESMTLDSAKCSGLKGSVEVVTAFPRVDTIRNASIVLALGPDKEEMIANGLSEDMQKAAKGMFANFRKKMYSSLVKKARNVLFSLGPSSCDDWVKKYHEFKAGNLPNGDMDTKMEKGTSATTQELDSKKRKKPIRYVFFTLGLPPGGGKSSLFHALRDATDKSSPTYSSKLDSLNVSYCYRSSDDFKGRDKFENALLRCLKGEKSQGKPSPKGEPARDAGILMVGYDKNIPDVDGLQRLVALLHPLENEYDIRVVPVVPEELDHDKFWNRVKLRDPHTHIGLAIGKDLTEKKAYQIFKTFFFDQCEEFITIACNAPGAIVTSIFTKDIASDDSNPLQPLVADMCTNLAEASLGASLTDLVDWLDSVDTGKGQVDGAASSKRSSPERANWCCADIDGHPNLHVTLVPPPVNDSDKKDQHRKATLKVLQSVAGHQVKIIASKYHVATLDESIEGGDEKGSKRQNKKRSRSSSGDPVQNVKRIAFWEVDRVEGLPPGIDLGKQLDILHITDRASMTRGVKAKFAAALMRKLRGMPSDLEIGNQKWKIETEQHPLHVSGSVSFYQ